MTKWIKHESSPVLGGDLGTCFDVSMLLEGEIIKMYFSWRDKKSIALTESMDGIHWSEPVIVLEPRETQEQWENRLNRPSVVYKDGVYHLWYTGQYHSNPREGTSHIFHAQSTDGVHFERTSDKPVLGPDCPWEDTSTMNPSVIWNKKKNCYEMWYCAGAQYEPKAIGHATSPDGLTWTKCAQNPVFEANPDNEWEHHKTAGCQVICRENDYLMFYIGYLNEDFAQIGMARSESGIDRWERYPGNPIIAPGEGWDSDACYKPFVLFHDGCWKLWYNGRKGSKEQIGLAIYADKELDF